MGKFIIDSKICTDDEQSKRLIQMGLNPETADMALHLSFVDSEGVANYLPFPIGHKCNGIPAWSLARLVGIAFGPNGPDSAFNDVIRFIDYQIEHGFIKSEYLKQ